MADDKGRGRFVWYDLMTRDAPGAVAFYSDVVGWGTEPFVMEGSDKPPYTMWTTARGPMGGLVDMTEEVPPEAPPHWLGYVGTPDVDATAQRAAELGGTVLHGPMDIPTVGRFAVIQDPQGAVFAAFTPQSEAPGRDGSPGEGEFSWHELATTDPDGAWGFYADLFGWEETDVQDMGEMGPYRMFGPPGGPAMGGLFRKPTEMPGPSAWLYYARVPDLEAATERTQEKGGRVLNGPMEVPGGDRIVQCMDPGGAAFAMHQVKGQG